MDACQTIYDWTDSSRIVETREWVSSRGDLNMGYNIKKKNVY